MLKTTTQDDWKRVAATIKQNVYRNYRRNYRNFGGWCCCGCGCWYCWCYFSIVVGLGLMVVVVMDAEVEVMVVRVVKEWLGALRGQANRRAS